MVSVSVNSSSSNPHHQQLTAGPRCLVAWSWPAGMHPVAQCWNSRRQWCEIHLAAAQPPKTVHLVQQGPSIALLENIIEHMQKKMMTTKKIPYAARRNMIVPGFCLSQQLWIQDGSVKNLWHSLKGFQEVHGMNHEPWGQTQALQDCMPQTPGFISSTFVHSRVLPPTRNIRSCKKSKLRMSSGQTQVLAQEMYSYCCMPCKELNSQLERSSSFKHIGH